MADGDCTCTCATSHADAVIGGVGNVVKSLERKVGEEAGRAAPRLATLADGRPQKADTTVGVELGWLRDVRSMPWLSVSHVVSSPIPDACASASFTFGTRNRLMFLP